MTKIPTLKEIYEQVIQELQNEFGATITVWGKVFLRAFAAVLAAIFKLQYLRLAFIQRNVFVDLADPEASGGTLERYGRIKLNRNPFPPTQGKYNIEVTGEINGLVKAGTTFKSDDSALNPGMLFYVDNDFTLTSNIGVLTVRALTAGTGSRLKIGDTLTATAPIVKVDRFASVVGEAEIPNDGESIEEYRAAIVESFRLTPQGGAAADYVLWAKDANGALKVYPYTSLNNNEVDVYVEASVQNSVDGMGTPTATILQNVESVIEIDPNTGIGRRPIGVFKVNVLPVVVNEIDIVIHDFMDLTAQKEATIKSALTELINNTRPFIPATQFVQDRNDSLSPNICIASILNVLPGASFGAIKIFITVGGGVPTEVAGRTFDFGNIPFLKTITYA